MAKRKRTEKNESGGQRLTTDDNESLKAEIAALKLRITDLKNQNNSLVAQNADLQRENHVLVQKAYPTKGLPSLCLERIISWCNIRDVFRGCMAVNKQWEQASRHEIRSRKCLKIYGMQDVELGGDIIESEMTLDPHDVNLIIFPSGKYGDKRCELFKSLKQMVSVTRLEVENHGNGNYDPLIIALSRTLKFVNLHSSDLPMDTRRKRKKRNLVYKQLQELECGCVGGAAGTKPFPNLRSFHSRIGETDLRKMPLSLHKLIISNEHHEYDSVTRQMDALTGLTNLTHLELGWDFKGGELPQSLIMQPFYSFRKLVRFHVYYKHVSLDRHTVDSAVESLVQRNPGLEGINIESLPATDASLESLSRLRKLDNLIFVSKEKLFTANAILTLLRSLAPGNTLRTVYLGNLKSNYDRFEFIQNVMAIPFPDSGTFDLGSRFYLKI